MNNLLHMEDSNSFPKNNSILEANLEKIKQDCEDLLESVNEFIDKNSKNGKYNKSEYDVLYGNLGNFYKLVINISHMDLRPFPIQKRFLYAEKKEFALNIKDSLRDLLLELEDLMYLEEENPFYEHL